MSAFSSSEASVKDLVRRKVPCCLVDIVLSESFHDGPFGGFVKRLENISEGVMTSVLHSNVMVLDDEEQA